MLVLVESSISYDFNPSFNENEVEVLGRLRTKWRSLEGYFLRAPKNGLLRTFC